MPRLILIRHGQSQWNLENRFTGWWDVDVTEKGAAEAFAAGRVSTVAFFLTLDALPDTRSAIIVRRSYPVKIKYKQNRITSHCITY